MSGLIDTLFHPLSWIIAPVVAFLISFLGLRERRIPIRLGASLFFSLAALLFFLLGTLNWFLRDGLGPDMIESHGWEALEHFFDLTSFVIYAVPFFAGVLLCLKDRLFKPPRRAVQD